ncbi:MAG: hypothetical protein M1817_003926 [Caeruleum heppii]|nr:MAG: hypothetical protein M1817_003926 [Caeruleum heppii]
MKTSIVAGLILLCGAVSAAPSPTLTKRDDPTATPISVLELPDKDWKCGSTTYNRRDVYYAIQWGVLLAEDDPPQGRGRKDNLYPNGRFPHPFTLNNNGPELDFNDCPDNDDARIEYPLVKNGPYNGSPNNNVKWGPDRAVYTHEPGEVDYQGNGVAKFCGIMTHTGAGDSSAFVLCK